MTTKGTFNEARVYLLKKGRFDSGDFGCIPTLNLLIHMSIMASYETCSLQKKSQKKGNASGKIFKVS